jgi:ABC-2 type transport system permease protein
MKTFYWLMKREFWEHRGGFLWTPVITGGIFLLLNIMGIVTAEVLGGRHGITVGGNNVQALLANADAKDLTQIGAALDVALVSATGLITMVMGFVVLFYCLGSLYDDRRDRSILFWKSLPISSTSTVLSKLASALVLAPVIAIVAGIVVGLLQLLLFTVVLSLHGLNVWQMLGLSHPFRAVAALIASVPLYALWALPAAGWLMFCSAAARSRPFLWAIAAPAMTGLLVTWFGIMGLFNLSAGWFWSNIVARSLLSIFPGSSFVLGRHAMAAMADSDSPLSLIDPAHAYTLLATPSLWIGVAAGAALIAGAIWFRRWRDDS